jgi:hypothetical protein
LIFGTKHYWIKIDFWEKIIIESKLIFGTKNYLMLSPICKKKKKKKKKEKEKSLNICGCTYV